MFLIGIILLLELLLGVIFNSIGFGFLKTPQRWTWLENYVNASPNSITIDYLFSLVGTFFIFMFISLSEEFVFRFTIYRHLRRKGLLFALLITTALFTFVHGVFNLTLVISALIYTLYYEYTNYFVGVVAIHTLNNFLVVYYSYYLTYLLWK